MPFFRPVRIYWLCMLVAVVLCLLNWPRWMGGEVAIQWQSASEAHLFGYYLYRLNEQTGELIRIHEQLVDARHGAIAGGSYTFIDKNLKPFAADFYVLEVFDRQGHVLQRQRVPTIQAGLSLGYEILVVIFLLAFGLTGFICALRPNKFDVIYIMAGSISSAAIAFSFMQPVQAAVVLSYFVATPRQNSVELSWETVNEINLEGFFIRRSLTQGDGYQRINSQIIPAAGDALLGKAYMFIDQTVLSGARYYYMLEAVDVDQNTTLFGPIESAPGLAATVTVMASPTRTVTQPPLRTPTRTATPVPPTRIVTSTFTPTPTTTYTITPIPEPTETPTPDLFDIHTITPVQIDSPMPPVIESMTQMSPSPAVEAGVHEDSVGWKVSFRDLGRIGLIVLIFGLWLLLGAWLYYYLARIQQ